MSALKPRKPVGLVCPRDPNHGPVIEIPNAPKLYCPSQAHSPRPRSHPLGPSIATSPWFTLREVETGVPA